MKYNPGTGLREKRKKVPAVQEVAREWLLTEVTSGHTSSDLPTRFYRWLVSGLCPAITYDQSIGLFLSLSRALSLRAVDEGSGFCFVLSSDGPPPRPQYAPSPGDYVRIQASFLKQKRTVLLAEAKENVDIDVQEEL